MKKGTFTSVWDGGFEVTTPAEFDEITGEVISESVDPGDVEVLDREFFTDENGDELTICPDCHTFIMTTKMFDGVGHTYEERSVCFNPFCENN